MIWGREKISYIRHKNHYCKDNKKWIHLTILKLISLHPKVEV